jgi:hypothetical protein
VNCTSCGATVRADSGRFCSHCAAVLPDAPRITADQYRTHPERYEAVAAHPQYPQVVASPPEVSSIGRILGPIVMMAFGVFFAFVATRGGVGHSDPFDVFLPLFMVAWFGANLYMLAKGFAFRRAPILTSVAVVVDERTNVSTSGNGKSRSTTTTYYATLQFRDGTRIEYSTSGALAGMVTVGDAGVAFTKADTLADFQRLAV